MNNAKLSELGVLSWRLDADIYETDEELKKIRHDRNYSYMVRFFNLCGHILLIILFGLENVLMLVKNWFEIAFWQIFVFPSTSSLPSMDLSISSIIFWLDCTIIVRTFVRFVQKSFQTMKRRLKAFMRNTFTLMRRSVIVWLGVVGLAMFCLLDLN